VRAGSNSINRKRCAAALSPPPPYRNGGPTPGGKSALSETVGVATLWRTCLRIPTRNRDLPSSIRTESRPAGHSEDGSPQAVAGSHGFLRTAQNPEEWRRPLSCRPRVGDLTVEVFGRITSQAEMEKHTTSVAAVVTTMRVRLAATGHHRHHRHLGNNLPTKDFHRIAQWIRQPKGGPGIFRAGNVSWYPNRASGRWCLCR
jgi:hypothetical protein